MINKKLHNWQLPLRPHLYANGIHQLDGKEWVSCEHQDLTFSNWKDCAVILSREHYVEQQKSYPVTNLVHLMRVIKVESQTLSPFGGKTFWSVVGKSSSGWLVTYWSVPQDVIASLIGKFKVVLPESLLLAKSVENGIFETIGKRGLFLYKQGHHFQSAIKNNLISNSDYFCNLVNRDDLVSQTTFLTHEEYQSRLIQSYKKCNPLLLPGLLIPSQQRSFDVARIKAWKKPAIMASVLMLSYAVGLSLYLSKQEEYYEQLLAGKQQEMRQLLKQEQQLNEIITYIEDYQFFTDSNPGLVMLLHSLVGVEKLDVQISRLDLTGNQVNISGLAPSATDLFSYLSKQPQIRNLDFSSTISKDRQTGLDRFQLTFTLSEVKNG
ncbi:PilN domain-containing protein [Vibrio atypicus]|uniref:PilN domain-containing protein n=1 Tax=Vibrio atypicus TaxID=558271 RepID=UPI003736D9AC